ncbi:NAD-dependent epimerase/dehydratase family protein [Marivita sp. S2033]|uniref:NAD-dependent epimerase/dehydratase family protein n=1 Tax=Marivita sp. S2033 TaxID=3373187 RepID=UPI003981A7A3
MGQVKRVLITGASGFIGRATVRAALGAGIQVVAVQRSQGEQIPNVSYVSTDLTVRNALPELTAAMAGCDAVIHLAAAMSGGRDAHNRLTIGGTETLLAAMAKAGVDHLTLASSIAVFDTSHVPVGGELTDDCPLEDPAGARDVYSAAKVRQEQLARAADLQSLAIVRPGIVYDESRLWNAHLGIGLGPVLLQIGGDDRLPMCHVDRCAAALVQATVNQVDATFVVLDPALPTRGQVVKALQETGWPKRVVEVPYRALGLASRVLRPVSGKLPGLLRERTLRQRAYPMVYSTNQPLGSEDWPDPSPDWKAAQ